MDLREKIAEILYQRPEYPSGMAEKLARDAAQRRADAVMGVVEEDAVKRRAYTERRVELARKAEAAKWETRVRELEEEIKQLRRTVPDPDDLAVVLKLTDTHAHKTSRLWGPDGRSCDKCTARFRVNAALSRAREIAEEEA